MPEIKDDEKRRVIGEEAMMVGDNMIRSQVSYLAPVVVVVGFDR